MLYLGFTGPRQIEIYQEEKIVRHLKKLNDEHAPAFAVTGACKGVDACVARWFAENTDVQNIIVVPAARRWVDDRLYALKRSVFLEMPPNPVTTNEAVLYRERNEKLVELADKLVAFRHHVRGGTQMTIDIATKAKKLLEIVPI